MTTITSVLAPGTTSADSTVIDVAADEVVTVGLYTAAGSIPGGSQFFLYKKTPGADALYTDGNSTKAALDRKEDESVSLSKARSALQVVGPAQFFVRRPAGLTVGVGVYKEV